VTILSLGCLPLVGKVGPIASNPACEAATSRRQGCRGCGRGASAILSKSLLLSRLETRTKESNTYASVMAEKPTRVMKVSGAKGLPCSISRP
jgi:hypothetical protein